VQFPDTGPDVREKDVFSRNVYCIQGLPVDAVEMADVVGLIRSAVETRTRLFLSTPNLNFLIGAQSDDDYRDTVIASDMNIADGMPLVWIARLLGLPIRTRLAGSDLLAALSDEAGGPAKPLKVAFFGGPEGAGAAACRAVNEAENPITCSGAIYPGFKSLEDLGSSAIIDEVNALDADFLIVALGARKGQLWLHGNSARLKAPVRSHLGALINMAAGTIRRAPPVMQRAGLEWLWRIREEPQLWRRYMNDGIALMQLMASRILPLAFLLWRQERRWKDRPFRAELLPGDAGGMAAQLSGIATETDRESVRQLFRDLSCEGGGVSLDLAQMEGAGPGFFGLLLVLHHHLRDSGRRLHIGPVSAAMERCFRLNGVSFLLNL